LLKTCQRRTGRGDNHRLKGGGAASAPTNPRKKGSEKKDGPRRKNGRRSVPEKVRTRRGGRTNKQHHNESEHQGKRTFGHAREKTLGIKWEKNRRDRGKGGRRGRIDEGRKPCRLSNRKGERRYERRRTTSSRSLAQP